MLGDDPGQQDLREQLSDDLELVLNTPLALNDSQRPRYLVKLGKTLYDLKRYQKARHILNDYIKSYPDEPNAYQAHLLLAMCCHEGFKDLRGYAYHAEKVLELKPDFADSIQVHLNLFSAYMSLAKEIAGKEPAAQSPESKQQISLLNKSAAHLYTVILAAPELAAKDNQLWLANFYYRNIKDHADEYFVEALQDDDLKEMGQRAQSIYENVLGIESLPLSASDYLDLEKELFKLSNIYAWMNQVDKQKILVNNLIEHQKAHPEWAWKLRSKALFALAWIYQSEGEIIKAQDTFQLLASSSIKSMDSFVASASKLQYSRISFAFLDESRKSLEDNEIVVILKHLKDLKIHKSLHQEPIHLEAALEYARIRSSLEPAMTRESNRLFLLTRAKEDFTSKEDVRSKDYHASRLLNPEKDVIYQAYLMLIDAQIARLEAKAAADKGLIEESEAKNLLADSLYKKLIGGKFAVTKYLIEQAKMINDK